MGNRFKCSLAHGGSGGSEGNTLIVTCDPAFAGHTISASKSGTTYTQTCPSSSPYTVTFHGLEAGTWTISATLSGDTYSTSVTITDSTALLSYGFNWATWVTLGGLDPTDYSNLSDVFADEAAVRRLMLVHASADYLIDAVTGDVDVIDDFCADDTAMKWIGLCDYVCDGLTAISGVETKFLVSTYWERYLKDHVPTMTGNNTPYGTVSASSTYSSDSPYKAFDGDDSTAWSSTSGASVQTLTIEFPTPICVKKYHIKSTRNDYITAWKLKGSNDGSTYTDLDEQTSSVRVDSDYTVVNNTYFKFLQIYITASATGLAQNGCIINTLQFYGRSLNVSVPVMTGNTVPFGVASASSEYNSNQAAWKAFDGIANTEWHTVANGIPAWLEYDFTSNVAVKMAIITNRVSSGDVNSPNSFSIEGSDNGATWDSVGEYSNSDNTSGHITVCNATKVTSYKKWRMNVTSSNGGNNYACVSSLLFFGVDYSEKEFEAGSTKKWIYDHGVMLEPISAAITTGGSITFNDDYIEINRNNSSANCSVATDSTVDLTGYSYLYAIVGIASGSALWHLIATSNRTAGTSSATAKADVDTASGDTKGGLDISSLNQALYLAVYAGNVAVQDLKELWVA